MQNAYFYQTDILLFEFEKMIPLTDNALIRLSIPIAAIVESELRNAADKNQTKGDGI